MAFPRGTTPTITLKLPSEYDLGLAENVYVTFQLTSGEIITKSGFEVEIDENEATVTLTQYETLKMSGGEVELQINWTYSDGSRWASKTAFIDVSKQLLREVVD